jgi:ATF/CREB family transcription factor
MAARAQSQNNPYNSAQAASASHAAQNPNIQPDLDSKPYNPNGSNAHQDSQDPFGSHQTNDAANGLFMLAQAGGQRGPQNNFPQPQSQQPPSQQQQKAQSQQQPSYQPSVQEKRAAKMGSIDSNNSDAQEGQYSDDQKPAAARNGRGKKGSATKPTAPSKRKTEETPAKSAASKKQRANSMIEPASEPEDEDMDDQDEIGADGRKMTDEEKRKNFLERNRYVYSPCNAGGSSEELSLITTTQGGRTQMSSTQEAMAGEFATQGRGLHK